MRVRFSNEVDYATEFTATSLSDFVSRSRRARMKFFGALGKTAKLYVHVQSDSGVWLPAAYPKYNERWSFLFSQQLPSDLYYTCRGSNAASTWTEFEAKNISKHTTT